MGKIKLFYSDKCPDCPPIIEALDQEKISYEKINVSGSMQELKAFLELRDNEEFFDSIKNEGRVGVPTLLIDAKLYDPYAINIKDLKKGID